jgi:hypothetical protein
LPFRSAESLPRGRGLDCRHGIGRRKGISQRFVEGFLAGAPLGFSVALGAGRLTAGFLLFAHFGPASPLEHDPEKWVPVSRLREALARFDIRFDAPAGEGRSEKIMLNQ